MHFLLDPSAIISALQHAMQLKQASFYSVLYDLFTNITNAKMFEAISVKTPDGLGVLSKLAKI